MIPRAHGSKPANHDRGPESTEDTQTDFAALDVLGSIPVPTTAVDACLDSGFHLNSGLKVTKGDGVLLVGGEVFTWRPWRAVASTSTGGKGGSEGGSGKEGEKREKAGMVNGKGQFELDESVWGVLGVVWPRPDILIIGMGEHVMPLSPETKRRINSLGIRVDVLDTRNAAAQFNLLATERGVSEVAAAMIPIGWNGWEAR
ncbi:hypothetical protein P168DRAFT_113180 [Aspergillus campestris IBT 28561]|uniref:NADH dehydrogenase [ubiquinone] 1 alpha subcomplex assembly factor 3 n=1 Tax=Aspergillus campestris (strain IBT 28561) TaxID=1392248 RepID=A0A2I1D9G6_ASPC2|nr:uncharacterized protein P168DRAFT_113180 [Aspergillus campestris IBT 28561]PKY06506.1 hypothetical protein P168DRAFT_113180 [Aspergillus campestris IBT 28561]